MTSTREVKAYSPTEVAGTPSLPSPDVNSKTMAVNPPTTNDTQTVFGDNSNVKWAKVNDASTSQSILPRPRHGHRAVAYGNDMIVFGGGNEGIVEELHVFDTVSHEWSQPQMKGEIPPGCAAYGLVLDGCRMLLYGGMMKYGRYNGDLYELNIPKWEWKKLKPKDPRNGEPPYARIGHSFTILRDQVFMFGGLANDSDDERFNIPRYLGGFYALNIRFNNGHGIWEIPPSYGDPPGPRESHSAVAYVSKDGRDKKLFIYGGMNGCRLEDLYVLDLNTLMWWKPQLGGTTPSPRSLHTATLVGEKMYVFGGWVPLRLEELQNSEKEWKCTNSLACFNVDSYVWENIHQDILDDKVPRTRAGHSAVIINTCIYIWSGRDGYKNERNNQVCCKDLWKLEVQKPGDSGKVQLLRAGTNCLEVGWNPVPGADSYVLQCVVYDVPLERMFEPVQPLQVHECIVPPAEKVTNPLASPPAPVAASPMISTAVPVSIMTGCTQFPVSIQAGSASPATYLLTPTAPMVTSSTSATHQQQPQLQQLSMKNAQSSVQLSQLSNVGTDKSTAMTLVSATSVSPAVLPTVSSLYTLPANVAGTASSLLVSKAKTRPAVSSTTAPQVARRGILRLRTPVQITPPRAPGTTTTLFNATALKGSRTASLLTNASGAQSVQLSGMNTLAAAGTRLFPTATQGMKLDSQGPGLQPGSVHLGSPVSSPVKQTTTVATTPTASNMKQILVQKLDTPGPPSSIKISKSLDGAIISWEPPLNTHGDVMEYSVYMAVKLPANAPEPKPGVTNMSFVRVYCGPSNQCNVPTASLNRALVDNTSEPAIIFRIAAKNEKEYGPAAQVRWLQVPNFSTPKTAILKRPPPMPPTARP
ncbi:unnamed protein product [Orchesella dallaii]|uniref:Host cell factor Kelch-repeats domain-containing protein n=1 Tax=Orchesella dallaii TaxID=48710 RepID=A0ABP1R2W5_9HEXA